MTARELINSALVVLGERVMAIDISDARMYLTQALAALAALDAEPVIGQGWVCGDHWKGLSGIMVDGNEGCPWCTIASLTAEIQEADEALAGDEGEPK